MDIVISPKSDKPLYQQVYEQIASQIISGDIPPETKLPGIRDVAAELHISVISVKSAWEMLDQKGLITTYPGRGTFVAPLQNVEISDKKMAAAKELLSEPVTACKKLGFTLEQLQELLGKLY